MEDIKSPNNPDNELELLRAQVAALEEEAATLRDKVSESSIIIKSQKETIAELKRKLYGRKSEKYSKNKSSGKNKVPVHDSSSSNFPSTDDDREEASDSNKDIKDSTDSRKNYLDTQELPSPDQEVPRGVINSSLERREIEIDTKPDDWSEETYEELQPKITERLRVIPAQVYVERIVRRVWINKETSKIPPLPPAPPHVFDRCSVHESVIIHIIMNRFLFHLPYYRQETMFRLMGLEISRDNMIRWCNNLALLFAPIVTALEEEIKCSRVLLVDETPFIGRIKQSRESKEEVKRWSKGKKNTKNEKPKYKRIYFWPLLALDIGVAFRWSDTRDNETCKDVLNGIGSNTAVLCDGLQIYKHCMGEVGFMMQLCWAHVRRKFYESQSSNQKIATDALDRIGKIFKAEKESLKNYGDPKKLIESRSLLVKPLVDSFIAWIESIKELPEVLTSSSLRNACNYLLNRKNEARHFLDNPYALMHNNDNERESKNFKLGAKNWLFVSSAAGADALAIYYSLIRSAQMHGIHPFYYLLDLCTRINQPGLKPKDLIPQEWKKRFFDEAVPEQYRMIAP